MKSPNWSINNGINAYITVNNIAINNIIDVQKKRKYIHKYKQFVF
jgi:hypothetical protein